MITSQSITAAIQERKSIRAYTDQPVKQSVIKELLEIARWAPSGSNRQPWRVTVASGEHAELLRRRLDASVRERPMTDEQMTATHRRIAEGPMAWILDHVDKPIWQVLYHGSMSFFGAPVALVWTYPGGQNTSVPAAIPAMVTTFMLAAHARDLGTVWLGWPLGRPEIVRETLQIPEEEQLGAFVALGHPDRTASINQGRSTRYDVDTFARWLGFDDEPE